MIVKTKTYCQVALSDKANEKLEKFQGRIKEKNLKMSKAEVINAILENMTMADFDRTSASLTSSSKAREKIMRLYKNSNMTKDDLEEILKRLP
ncbi:TPA: hypothetical protein RMT52_005062 [Escherichia coli]|nr:hypothetical protein [Escherichia coli]HAX1982834.1 hypothetical protein [Escherichia coli]HAX2345288.1 hypothetical protein [Escherichia coli]HBN7237030.1 hypothetical protein [Escherichia coli]HBN7443565.1 hypothetical protein [Escherichia coli]